MADIQDRIEETQVPCPACDKPNQAGYKFCRHCGTSPAGAATPPPVAASPECRKCATVNKAGAKFCRACGESISPAIALELEPEPEPELEPVSTAPQQLTESGAISLLTRKAKTTLTGYLIAGAVGVLVIIGGGYALTSAMAENEGPSQTAAMAEIAANEMASEVPASTSAAPVTPVMQGAYAALLSDQNVVLTVIGSPASVAKLGATVTYSNVVTGRSCGSALEPESRNGNATESAASVNFRQVTVAGQIACPRAIPVNLDISGQPTSADGVAQSVQATWLNPDTGAVMMSGRLVRNAAQ